MKPVENKLGVRPADFWERHWQVHCEAASCLAADAHLPVAAMFAVATRMMTADLGPRSLAHLILAQARWLMDRADAIDLQTSQAIGDAQSSADPDQADHATQTRRAELLPRVIASISEIGLEASSLSEANLDLASVMFACGLGIAEAEIGTAGVAQHLAALALTWSDKVQSGEASQRPARAVH